jgi:hypothetical protein
VDDLDNPFDGWPRIEAEAMRSQLERVIGEGSQPQPGPGNECFGADPRLLSSANAGARSNRLTNSFRSWIAANEVAEEERFNRFEDLSE